MKTVAILVAILSLLSLSLLALEIQDHTMVARMGAGQSALEQTQRDQASELRELRRVEAADLAAMAADVADLTARLERPADPSSAEADQAREARRLAGLEQRLLSSVSALEEDLARAMASVNALSEAQEILEQRVAAVSLGQKTLGEQIDAVSRSQERLGDRIRGLEAAASALSAGLASWAAPPAASADQPAQPPRFSPEQDLPLQRRIREAGGAYEAGRYAQAARIYGRVLELQPDNGEARLRHAVSLFKASPGESALYPGIEQDLLGLQQSGACDAEGLRVLGLLSVERGRWDDALGWFRQVIAMEPGRANDVSTAGLCSLRLGDFAAAARYFDAACSLSGEDAEAWYRAGVALESAGDPEAALFRLERCLDLDPAFAAARVEAGRTYASLGRWSEALAVVEPRREDPEALEIAGVCHARLGDPVAARTAWSRAIAMIRENTAADRTRVAGLYLRLARLAFESGAHAQCVSWCEEGLRREDAPLLRLYRARSSIALGEVEEGTRALRRIAEGHPDSEAGRLARAVLDAGDGPGRQ